MSKNRDTVARIAMAAAAGSALLIVRAAVHKKREYDFREKVVLITGGSRGLGLVLARQFAAAGAKLVICARDPEELSAAHSDLEARGARVLALPCDVSNREEVNRSVDRALDHYGRIDVLVNNAGTMKVGPVEQMTMEDYHYAMDTNFWGAVNMAYRIVPHMQSRGSGRLVNISSVGGKIGVPHLLPYCAGKFALTGWSRGLRSELAKDGIYVTTVCPGLMRTGSPRNAEFKGHHKAEYGWFSISDSLPGISVSAETAASQILQAAQRGDVELIVGGAAKTGVLLDSLFPEWSTEVASLACRLLPGPNGARTEPKRGSDSESPATQSFLTGLTRKAEQENNQLIS